MALFDQTVVPADAEVAQPKRADGHRVLTLFLGSAIVGSLLVIFGLTLALGSLPLWAWIGIVGVEAVASVFVAAALLIS